MIKKALLRFARAVVQNVMAQVMKQINEVQQQAYSPIQQMVQQVVSGIWIGRGADAFVEELNGLIMPDINQVTDNMTLMNNNIQQAVEIIDQADAQVTTAVNSLGDVFAAIY